jgi:hypothetical protein
MAALPLLDFKLLPKSGSGISLSSESVHPRALDVPTTDGSRSAISGPTLVLKEFDGGKEALDRHRPDQKLCSPLPSLALRDNADANAKAKYAASRSAVHLSGKKIPGARRVVLFVRRFRCGRGGEFLEARIISERIEHGIEPEQRGGQWRARTKRSRIRYR